MSVTDELLKNNERYAEGFDKQDLPAPHDNQTAVVARMDARLNIYATLSLSEGETHVICNAGGVVTEDVMCSLTISQGLLGSNRYKLTSA